MRGFFLGVGVALGDGLGLGEVLGLGEGLGEGDGVAEGVGEADGVGDADGLGEGEGDGVGVLPSWNSNAPMSTVLPDGRAFPSKSKAGAAWLVPAFTAGELSLR